MALGDTTVETTMLINSSRYSSRVRPARRVNSRENAPSEARTESPGAATLEDTSDRSELVERALPAGGALLGGAIGAGLAGAYSGAATAILGGAMGAFLGYLAGKTYQIPDHLYHFTSRENAAKIRLSGALQARPGNHGKGVYATRFQFPLVATLQRAASTDIRFKISTDGMRVERTFVPGTYRLLQDVPWVETSAELVESGVVTEALQEADFRDMVNPNG